jgi:broad specificity phosphatase PhoE
MSDRINYDEMVAQWANDSLDGLNDEDILKIDPDQYANTVWNAGDPPETDDLEEAWNRFMDVFVATVQNAQSIINMMEET